jgi:hypothetical protein
MDTAGVRRRIITWQRICCSIQVGDQKEARALSGELTRPWSLMSFAAGRLSDR